MRLSKRGVIPHLMRDLLPLIWVGDTGSWSGMTEWKIFQQYRALFGQPQIYLSSAEETEHKACAEGTISDCSEVGYLNSCS